MPSCCFSASVPKSATLCPQIRYYLVANLQAGVTILRWTGREQTCFWAHISHYFRLNFCARKNKIRVNRRRSLYRRSNIDRSDVDIFFYILPKPILMHRFRTLEGGNVIEKAWQKLESIDVDRYIDDPISIEVTSTYFFISCPNQF